MSFVARAGSVVDRGHRMIGVLLVVIIVQFVWVNSIMTNNEMLQGRISMLNKSQSIYVVPNSQAGVYRPAEGRLLLTTFVDYFTQSLMTYTPATYQTQYKSIRTFLAPKLLEKADSFYTLEIKKSGVERISSLFIIDRTSTELSEFKQVMGLETRYGEKTYAIKVKGVVNTIVGGKVIQEKGKEILLHLQETQVSKANPFGFVVTKFKD